MQSLMNCTLDPLIKTIAIPGNNISTTFAIPRHYTLHFITKAIVIPRNANLNYINIVTFPWELQV